MTLIPQQGQTSHHASPCEIDRTVMKREIYNKKWEKLVDFLNWNGRKDGIVAKAIYGDINLLKKYIASGYPLLVRQWKNSNKRSKHYRVIIGYDEQKQEVIYHDPNRWANMKMDYKTFNDLWDIQTERMHWSSKNLMIAIGRFDKIQENE